MKDLLIKKHVNSNLNADQSNFLANKTVRLALGLYGQNNMIQNNSCSKLNLKIVYCSLKSVSLVGIGARGDSSFEER